MKLFTFVTLTFLLSGSALAAPKTAAFHARVYEIYNFHPRDLNQAAQAEKSKQLDTFWHDVKSSGAEGLVNLRDELSREDSPPFFSYDGAKLLLSISKTHDDRILALTAIARSDLRDLQQNDYFYTVHSFAVDEFDTSEAAMKILTDDKFRFFVPQHSLTLTQEMCLLFLLGPIKDSYYLSKAESRLFNVKTSVTAKKSLLTLLGYTVTKQGDAALARFAADNSQPAEARDYANKIVAAVKSMGSTAAAGKALKSYGELKAEQRKDFGRVSDEALYDVQDVQVQLRQIGAQ